MALSVFSCPARSVCQRSAVERFRRDGVVVVQNLVQGPLLQQLSEAGAALARERGARVFPASDPEHSGALQFDMQVKPKAAAKLSELPPPEDLKKVLTSNDAKQALDRHVRTVELKCANQRKVDRLYRQLVRRRNRFHQLKQIPAVLTEEEELAGEITEQRKRQIEEQFTYDRVKSSFEQYRDDGKMELEIRRENHIDDALQFLENWGRFWVGFWPRLPEEMRVALGNEVGSAVAFLSGEVSLRLYSDTLQEFVPFTNGIPFHCSAPGLNFRHLHSVNVFIRLDSASAVEPLQVVVPGSHHTVLDLTDDGRDFSSLSIQQVLDMGYLMRHTPELRSLKVVELPPIPPGAAVVMSTYLVHAVLPQFVGQISSPYCFPAQKPSQHPHYYQLTVMPDRCTFDGHRNSWFSKDSNGPLYHSKKGDLLDDELKFPVLHRALDIE